MRSSNQQNSQQLTKQVEVALDKDMIISRELRWIFSGYKKNCPYYFQLLFYQKNLYLNDYFTVTAVPLQVTISIPLSLPSTS